MSDLGFHTMQRNNLYIKNYHQSLNTSLKKLMEQLVKSQNKTIKQPLKKYKCLMLMQDNFLKNTDYHNSS